MYLFVRAHNDQLCSFLVLFAASRRSPLPPGPVQRPVLPMNDDVSQPATSDVGDGRIDVTPPPVVFRRQAVASPQEKAKLRTFRANLVQCLTLVAQKGADKPVAGVIEKRLSEFVYKYANAHRHQKFFQVSRQVSSHLRRVNANSVVSAPAEKVSEGLVKCQYSHAPTDGAVTWIANTLLSKIQKLDILRIHCRRACILFSAYLERGHFLNLLLSMTAMLAELASAALHQIHGLRSAYDSISKFAHSVDPSLPTSSKEFPFQSEQIQDTSITPKGAEIAISFASRPKSEHKNVSKGLKQDIAVEEEKPQEVPKPVQQQPKDNDSSASLLQQLKVFSSQNKRKHESDKNIFGRNSKKFRR
uniref:DUF4477 domain-containing protein n=1 Tax=Panagrellus redivivus TaxID=6233 RepID=A0A7E4WAM2_PANRE